MKKYISLILKNTYFKIFLIILASLIIFFHKPLFSNHTLVPLGILREFDLVFKKQNSLSHNYLLSDVVDQFYPNYHFLSQNISQGHLPFWNPYILTGTPFYADSQVAVFELTHLLSYLWRINPLTYPLFSAMILLSLLAAFSFIYFCNLGSHKPVALFGTVALMFSGPVIVWINYPLMTAFIWLPLLLFCIDKIILSKHYSYLPFLSFAICFMFLAGYPQIGLINLIISGTYFLFRSLQRKKLEIKIYLLTIIFVLLGIGMSTIQIGPSWNFIRDSSSYEIGRGHIIDNNFWEASQKQFLNFSENLKNFFRKTKTYGIATFYPKYYGSPLDRNYQNPENNPYANFNEITIYTGLLTIFLAIFSLFWIRANKAIIFWLLSAIFSFGLAADLPFINLAKYLPLINKISHSRFRLFFAFAVIVLAIYVLEEIYKYLKKQNLRKAKIFILIITLITFCDLFYFFANYNPSIPKDINFLRTNEAIEFLQNNTEYERIIGLGNAGDGFRTTLIPNLSTIFGLYDVRGYNPIVGKNYTDFASKYLTRRGSFVLADAVFDERVIDMLGVKYMICPKDNCTVVRQSEEWILEYRDTKIDVFRNPNFLPRAYVAYDFIQSSSSDQTLSLLESPSFDPYTQIIIEDSLDLPKITNQAIQKASIIKHSSNEVIINVGTRENGVVVLADSYDDGWRVSVNGEAKNIFLVNGIFRGVKISSGENKIIFNYTPKNFYFYSFISLISLLGVIVLSFVLWKKF